MKFTDLLKNWIDEQREIMIKYEDQINEIIEDMQAFERLSELDYDV